MVLYEAINTERRFSFIIERKKLIHHSLGMYELSQFDGKISGASKDVGEIDIH